MEVSSAIRKGYITALKGNVTYQGLEIPIYDAVAPEDSTGYPYIIISSQTSNQRQVKRCKMYNATILIDIVTGSQKRTGKRPSEIIAEQIENLINTTDIDLTQDGYQVLDTNREEDSDLNSKNELYFIYRKLMRYGHLVNKL